MKKSIVAYDTRRRRDTEQRNGSEACRRRARVWARGWEWARPACPAGPGRAPPRRPSAVCRGGPRVRSQARWPWGQHTGAWGVDERRRQLAAVRRLLMGRASRPGGALLPSLPCQAALSIFLVTRGLTSDFCHSLPRSSSVQPVRRCRRCRPRATHASPSPRLAGRPRPCPPRCRLPSTTATALPACRPPRVTGAPCTALSPSPSALVSCPKTRVLAHL